MVGFKLARRVAAIVVLAVVAYLGVNLAQVWLASRRDQARPADAIVVLGAAQFNGHPSKVLRARLDHAADLYARHLADVVFVTGGKQPADTADVTESSVAADYLAAHGVPQSSVLRENQGRNSWNSLAAASRVLKERGKRNVILVSDPFHSARIAAMARELGLRPLVSPTRTSPITGVSSDRYMLKEAAKVSVGRVVGFRRLMGIDDRVVRARQRPANG